MSLFDVSKYEVPNDEDVDLVLTRKNFEIFIRAYKNSREKAGQPRVPKVTQSFSLIPPSTANGVLEKLKECLFNVRMILQSFKSCMNYSSKDLLLSHIHLDQKLQKDVDNIYLTVSTRIYRKRDSRNDSC